MLRRSGVPADNAALDRAFPGADAPKRDLYSAWLGAVQDLAEIPEGVRPSFMETDAFRDMRDAVVAQGKTREQFDAEDRRAATLREALRLAKLRYQSGVASQLDVLDAERNLLAAELNRSDTLRAQRAAVADLFKALGGGWNPGS